MRCKKCKSEKVIFKYSEKKSLSDWSEEVEIVEHYKCLSCGNWIKKKGCVAQHG